ncbi:MAG: F0F1 ATP synthase subunit A [Alphaproteobacteria bacterium]
MAVEHSPLEQFAVTRIVELNVGGVDVSFTNSSAMMVLVVALVTLFLTMSTRGHTMVPGRWQSLAELSYEMMAKTVRDTIGPQGRPFFPFIFTLFMFILLANYLSLVPGAFTVTAHIAVTFAMAICIFIGATILGFVRHGFRFLRIFMPSGIPIWVGLLLVPIEFISYLSRPMSLSIRLAANLTAGHTMLHVFAGFVIALGIFGIFPFVFIVLLYALEVIIALIQAYVFAILTCIYLGDSIHLAH